MLKWDNDVYREKFAYKIQQGLELAAMVKPVRGQLLELGSETGILSYQLWKMEYKVEGVEFDYKLVDMARRTTAKSVFYEGDPDDVLLYENRYPMVIANDVLHKVPEEHQEYFLKNVYNCMTEGGEMAFNMGAEGNNAVIEEALAAAFAEEGLVYQPLFFPTEEVYEDMLENAGFKVDRIFTMEKPQQVAGEDGLAIFIEMFRRRAFKKLDDEVVARIIGKACDACRDELFDVEKWTIPYIRLVGKVVK